MDLLQQLRTQLGQLWRGMSGPRKLLVAGSTTATVLFVLGLGYWASQGDYQPLFVGLSVEDAGAITEKLQADNVPFKLTAAGTTILVPAEQVQQLRVSLAVDGLPAKGGKGYELFDQSAFGMTPFTQHVNHLRALQGELAKTIMQIDPVVAARVHVVRSEPTPFLRDQKPTTASIMLKLRPGASLNRNVSAGIIALVARSVEGLSRENVTLVDASGRLLSHDRTSEDGIMAAQVDMRRDLESYLASKAETMLAQVLGMGRAIVRVTADVNMKHHRESKVMYQPENRVITSEKIQTTRSTTGAGGKAPPGKSGATTGTAGSNNVDESIQTDYVVSKVTQELDNRIGAIERLTVAALVDLAPSGDDAGKSGLTLSLADAQDIIKKAVGFKTDRDEIKVTEVRLPESLGGGGLDMVTPEPYWPRILVAVRNVSLALAALVFCALGVALMRRMRTPKTEPAAEPAPAAPPSEEILSMQRLTQVLQRDPDALAKVLEKWLNQPGPSSPAKAA